MTQKNSVFNPVEQRLFGVVQIAQGVATVVLGKYAPSWTLAAALWGAKRSARRHAQ